MTLSRIPTAALVDELKSRLVVRMVEPSNEEPEDSYLLAGRYLDYVERLLRAHRMEDLPTALAIIDEDAT